ncbi:MAG: hypothetical protein K2G04_00895, partial [Oscillospiraceae bacterium]|nr:hypothetical protein [Oscillospiraceae bacterium]
GDGMNMISSTTAPYLLYAEQSGKPRETYGNRFSDALEEEKAKNNIEVSAAEIAVNEMNRVRTEDERRFRKECESVLKVKDVLSQIFVE